jgi:acyl dehydratase
MVHGAQTVRVFGALPPAGRLSTTARVKGVYDMKRLAQVVCSTETRLGDQVIYGTDWQLLFLDQGGFGGPHPPKALAPKAPSETPPSFEHEEATSAEQALLYRLSGDSNPLHVDPEFAARAGFPQGPILHGLCTFGFIARAVAQRALDGDASRLRSLTAQFRKPVWPGESLRTVGYRIGSQIVVKTYAGGREDAVVTGCYADVV